MNKEINDIVVQLKKMDDSMILIFIFFFFLKNKLEKGNEGLGVEIGGSR